MNTMDQLEDAISHAVSGESADQYTAFQLIHRHRSDFPQGNVKILDLGCGTGASHDPLASEFPDMDYTGVDIEGSPEVLNRKRSDLKFETFNGTDLPFEDGSFDVVFCKQVLEHVRYPDALISEVNRALKSDGIFVGSVSFLEPYHSYSIFNWSPYGVYRVLKDNGLELTRIHPGIDGVSMIFRLIFGRNLFRKSFALSSLLNHYIETEGEGMSIKRRNIRKIAVSGHLIFMARKA